MTTSEEMTRAEAYRRHERNARIRTAVISILLVVTISLLAWMIPRIQALSTALDAANGQVEQLGAEPVAPPSDEVLRNPAAVGSIQPVSAADLQQAVRDVFDDVAPALESDLDAAAARYVSACIDSGDCVGPVGPAGTDGAAGPAGPAGEDGQSPSPADVAAAVVAVCNYDIDCTASPDRISSAVAAYCGGADQPCGDRWTEKQIYDLAMKAIVTYTGGRPIWCPREDEVPNDAPFGPCYLSVG